ncbi:MAG: alpha/beta hydrolase fold domain-containing protein, partial [Candidatus Binatia bacterium]
AVSSAALVFEYFRGRDAGEAVERALSDAFGERYREKLLPEIAQKMCDAIEWRRILLPFPMRHPDVERSRDILFHRARGVNLRLDVYRHRSHPQGCPVLLEVHGGGWILGSKNEQGIPLMLRMAAQGWVCVSADYRLSPHATFPEHLIDVKKAIRWIREHVGEYGGDPTLIVVAGQSAGGHLATLAALTANQPEYQPGFEQADTRLQGCVSFYGVYDFTNRHGLWAHEDLARLLEQKVMKASMEEAPELYEKASPMSQISPDDPPFFVIHGDRDTLVPVGEARRFCDDLRKTAQEPVAYAEIHGAQHAFEIFPSLRGELVLAGVERFLGLLWSAELRSREASGATAARAS